MVPDHVRRQLGHLRHPAPGEERRGGRSLGPDDGHERVDDARPSGEGVEDPTGLEHPTLARRVGGDATQSDSVIACPGSGRLTADGS